MGCVGRGPPQRGPKPSRLWGTHPAGHPVMEPSLGAAGFVHSRRAARTGRGCSYGLHRQSPPAPARLPDQPIGWSRLPPVQDPEPTSFEAGVPIQGTVGGYTALLRVIRVTARSTSLNARRLIAASSRRVHGRIASCTNVTDELSNVLDSPGSRPRAQLNWTGKSPRFHATPPRGLTHRNKFQDL